MTLLVRLTPKGGANRIEQVGHDAEGRAVLKVRVTAPPEDGKANRALLKLIAKSFGVPVSKLSILQGAKDRDKRIKIEADPILVEEKLKSVLRENT